MTDGKSRIIIQKWCEKPVSWIYSKLTNHVQVSKWFGKVIRQPYGFDVELTFSLATIRLTFRIVEKIPNKSVSYRVKTQYIKQHSLVTFEIIQGTQNMVRLVEIANYDESRWTKAKSIHTDIYSEAMNRLISLSLNE